MAKKVFSPTAEFQSQLFDTMPVQPVSMDVTKRAEALAEAALKLYQSLGPVTVPVFIEVDHTHLPPLEDVRAELAARAYGVLEAAPRLQEKRIKSAKKIFLKSASMEHAEELFPNWSKTGAKRAEDEMWDDFYGQFAYRFAHYRGEEVVTRALGRMFFRNR